MGATNKINGNYESDKELYWSTCLYFFFFLMKKFPTDI